MDQKRSHEPASSVMDRPEQVNPWDQHLDDLVAEKDFFLDGLAVKLKTMLSDSVDSTAVEFARAFDESYGKDYLRFEPLASTYASGGMDYFLQLLWENICDLGRFIPYDDHRQPLIVQSIVESRALPPKRFKIFRQDCSIYQKESVFGEIFEGYWQRSCALESKTDSTEQTEQRCAEWENLSSFFARCIAAGLLDSDGNRCRYAAADVAEGLEGDYAPTRIQNCKVLISAQYLILTGATFYGDYILNTEKGSKENT